jgi:CMP-N-acetylneuraminic acid synthetase
LKIPALIPARGGSKGLPGKNVRPFLGRPLIARSIDVAKAARNVSRVVVTTDDAEIARVARAAGAEVPFLRPAELATDVARARDVYVHAIDALEREWGATIDSVCVLQPTSPLRTAEDVDRAIDLFHARQAASVVSVCEMHPPPGWAKAILPDGTLDAYPGVAATGRNRQEELPAYAPNGAVFVFRAALLREDVGYYVPGRTFPYVMPKERSVDIDDAIDFALAELLAARA